MSDVGLLRNKALLQTKAGKVAAKIHAADLAETIAARVKDASALEGAVLKKLDAQCEFAGEYHGKFPAHTGVSASTGAHPKDEREREKWCLAFGFALRTVQRWCELLEPEKYASKKNAVLDRCWKLAELWQAANYSSDSIEWYTPLRYIEAVREVLGQIDLDPASNTLANETIRAEQIFTKETNALHQQWHGRVFMNPPYGVTEDNKSLAAAFCNKAIREYESGNVQAAIILVNSLHSQAWQAPLYEFPVCFVDHRIQFISGDGEINKNPTFQNIFIYLGEHVAAFAEKFSRFGYVMRKV